MIPFMAPGQKNNINCIRHWQIETTKQILKKKIFRLTIYFAKRVCFDIDFFSFFKKSIRGAISRFSLFV